jgi:O-succinylbenzoic acid--CoA ligase
MPPGPGWPELVGGVWEAGAALLPVDHRQTRVEIAALLRRVSPTLVVDGEGWHRQDGGVPVEPGTSLVIATSGTSAAPRLVELSRSAVSAAVAASLTVLAPAAGDRWLACLPLAHIGGLLVLLRALLSGAEVAVHQGFDPASVAAAADGHTHTSLVATALDRLLDAGADLAGFRSILVGGAGVPDGLRERAARAGGRCIATYGQTESCGGVIYDGVALPGVGVRIAGSGEIELCGPTLMRGYRGDAAASSAAFTDDGWLRTGDAGSIDSTGRLRVSGRLDEAIISGGEKIWPREVEAVLRRHPLVAEVAVVGRADPRWGARVVAVVVPADPARPPALEELRDFTAAQIARHKAPRELVLVAQLPRTGLGKVRRAELRR